MPESTLLTEIAPDAAAKASADAAAAAKATADAGAAAAKTAADKVASDKVASDKAAADAAAAAAAQTPEQKAAAAKATADAATAKAAADAAAAKPLELKLPAGSALDAEDVKEVTEFATANKLSPEAAQKMLDREHAIAADIIQAQKDIATGMPPKWVEAVKADPQLGGANFDSTIAMAQKPINAFGSEAFKKALNESGLGSHPEMVRFCAAIGKLMGEDKLVIPSEGGRGPAKTFPEALYPDKPKA